MVFGIIGHATSVFPVQRLNRFCISENLNNKWNSRTVIVTHGVTVIFQMQTDIWLEWVNGRIEYAAFNWQLWSNRLPTDREKIVKNETMIALPCFSSFENYFRINIARNDYGFSTIFSQYSAQYTTQVEPQHLLHFDFSLESHRVLPRQS